jgi:TusA-related sulfurtransferase
MKDFRKAKMTQESAINLIGVFSPFCLMKIKQLMLGLSRGESLQILLQDSEVVDDLKRIFDCSSDDIIDIREEQNHFRILIRKG